MAPLTVIPGGRMGPPPSLEARRNAYRRRLVAMIRAAAYELPERRRRKILDRLPAWDLAAQRGDWTRLVEVAIELAEEDRRVHRALMQPGDDAA